MEILQDFRFVLPLPRTPKEIGADGEGVLLFSVGFVAEGCKYAFPCAVPNQGAYTRNDLDEIFRRIEDGLNQLLKRVESDFGG